MKDDTNKNITIIYPTHMKENEAQETNVTHDETTIDDLNVAETLIEERSSQFHGKTIHGPEGERDQTLTPSQDIGSQKIIVFNTR